MSYIKSRKHAPKCPFPALSTATLAAGLAMALPAVAAEVAPADAADQATTLDKVQVRGLHSFIVSPKFTQTLQDTPQTIQVIDKELFNQQGATTLTEALRNSAGVGTFYAGENGNTSTGDTLYMRGFDSSSSIFVDGIRDLGSVSRDLFNIEQVEVVKGPASTDTGRSAPTGAINLVTKQANLRNAASGTVSAGNDGQQRANADWNHAFGESGNALRLNAMWQVSDVPGRDHVNNSRWGIAPSLGFNLEGATRVYLNLLYVKQDNVPDGFVPTIGMAGWKPQNGLAALVGHPVDPENFYGTRADHDDVTAQMATLRVEHDFSDTLKLSNTLRWGKTQQDYLLTSFRAMSSDIAWTDPSDLSTYTIKRGLPTFKDQRNEILTDQLNLRADFATGAVQHFVSTGVEFAREDYDFFGQAATGGSAWTPAKLYDPDWNATGLTWAHNGADRHGKTTTVSAYVFDTLKFGDSFLLTAGLRADRYRIDFRSAAVCGTPPNAPACAGNPAGTVLPHLDAILEKTLVSGKLGAVYKLGDTVSLYANWAISQQPPGGGTMELSGAANNANNPKFEPQKARTLEVGTKWNLIENALAFNLALFDTEVANEVTPDPTLPGTYVQTGRKSVKGIEASVVGNITESWSVSAGLSHLSSQVEAGALVSADGSRALAYTPDNAFTAWTTYRMPFGLSVGGGLRYVGGLTKGSDGADTANGGATPANIKSYTVYDAVLSYPINDKLTLRFNGYNLFDKQYVAAINKSGYRYTPGTPRTFLLSADFRF
ncbi:catecholate siderophore receptor Fiu [Pseudoxanthomonas helianthi]|uniref:Catecholate siderophore receptor Fiu n=1 Tax=Pseudoxanthomonas helianthi TaxID=1453541 RepID=A0A940X2F9_9GAMM|nr:catecholate siderophore receptor Fiu [Pseudoxanthomonas helianthi]MBP3982993.1 catecholate siderophore receptor Fiu [Pseudoxanthomonas helianthi]